MLDKDTIKDLCNKNLSGREICSILGERWTVVKYYASQNGLNLSHIPYNTPPKAITEKDLADIINVYSSGEKSVTALAAEYNVDRKILADKMKEKNVVIRPSGAKPLDEEYFDQINTAEKAYWLGFLFADGYVGNNNAIEFALQETDRYAVENFKTALKSGHKINVRNVFLVYNGRLIGRKAVRITVKNKHMAESLISKGCKNNKSLTLDFPDFNAVPRNLFSHFIRGYFDGDGCVYTGKKHKRRCVVSFSCASYKYCLALADFILNELNIVMHIIKNQNVYSVNIFKKEDVKTFLEYIYKDSTENTRLKRKYEKSLISLNSCRPDSTTTEESVTINGELSGKAKARKSHANPSPKAAKIVVRRNA